jgi:hypothetical protein
MKYLYEALTYINIALLGGYATAQFKFNTPVPLFKWAITLLFFFLWVYLHHREQNDAVFAVLPI